MFTLYSLTFDIDLLLKKNIYVRVFLPNDITSQSIAIVIFI